MGSDSSHPRNAMRPTRLNEKYLFSLCIVRFLCSIYSRLSAVERYSCCAWARRGRGAHGRNLNFASLWTLNTMARVTFKLGTQARSLLSMRCKFAIDISVVVDTYCGFIMNMARMPCQSYRLAAHHHFTGSPLSLFVSFSRAPFVRFRSMYIYFDQSRFGGRCCCLCSTQFGPHSKQLYAPYPVRSMWIWRARRAHTHSQIQSTHG